MVMTSDILFIELFIYLFKEKKTTYSSLNISIGFVKLSICLLEFTFLYGVKV